jgi:hypothetical protein
MLFLFQQGSSSSSSNPTVNPGYLQGTNIVAGIGNGSMIRYE